MVWHLYHRKKLSIGCSPCKNIGAVNLVYLNRLISLQTILLIYQVVLGGKYGKTET